MFRSWLAGLIHFARHRHLGQGSDLVGIGASAGEGDPFAPGRQLWWLRRMPRRRSAEGREKEDIGRELGCWRRDKRSAHGVLGGEEGVLRFGSR